MKIVLCECLNTVLNYSEEYRKKRDVFVTRIICKSCEQELLSWYKRDNETKDHPNKEQRIKRSLLGWNSMLGEEHILNGTEPIPISDIEVEAFVKENLMED